MTAALPQSDASLDDWSRRARQLLARVRALRPLVVQGNRVQLLVNGEEYFPSLLEAVASAHRSVHLETYILADDKIGERVLNALSDAASRGVEVRVLVDGYGGGAHARRLAKRMHMLGVELCIFRPERWWHMERRLLQRLHRKLAVIDDRIAFVGGINIIDDWTDVPVGADGRARPRFDFAVRCEGPLVGAIALAMRRLWSLVTLLRTDRFEHTGNDEPLVPQPIFDDGVSATLLLRDNLRNRHAIERNYLDAFARASHDILIANAYFLPGRRVLAALRAAAARGVRVRLLLQGRVEYALQHHAQRAMYGDLLGAGIEIHEYQASYLHAKVAVIDEAWATVGSSNIDPYSLLLAREANVVVLDARFATRLRTTLELAIETDSEALPPANYLRRGLFTRLLDWAAYGVVRAATALLARQPNY